jgi:hypothetical protein
MQTLPAYLPYGVIAVYGYGTMQGVQGIIPPAQGSVDYALFGTVYQISQHEVYFCGVGDSVLFKNSDVICRLATVDASFTLVEDAKLVCKEYPPS